MPNSFTAKLRLNRSLMGIDSMCDKKVDYSKDTAKQAEDNQKEYLAKREQEYRDAVKQAKDNNKPKTDS